MRIPGLQLCCIDQHTSPKIEDKLSALSNLPLNSIHRHLKILQRLVIVYDRVRQDECAKRDIAARLPILRKDDLVEMCRHSNIRRTANNLVTNAPLAINGIFLRQIQRSRHNPDARIETREPPTEIFKMRPVVPVETVALLRTHVAKRERRVHGLLAPFCIRGRDLVPAVVATAEIVFEFCAKFLGDAAVFSEEGMSSVAVLHEQRGRCDVLGDPIGIARRAVEGGG